MGKRVIAETHGAGRTGAVRPVCKKARMMRRVAPALVAALAIQPMYLPQASAQTPPVQQGEAAAQTFDTQQLDALLAPVALYPDSLLTQLLMASTFPLQVVEADRWVKDPAHKDLKGDALAKALEKESWDPSVKSLVPFPQILDQMNSNLDWMQQVGYAFATQQKDVLDSVQRLRRQAQDQGHLQSTSQQVVRAEPQASGQQTIIIEPAQPNVVYVPSYNPTVVYGAWPYPAYPPVALPPPPGYVAGTALLSGLAFGTGVAITAGLWGWASPNWGRGDVNVNVNRWNNINVNRQHISSNVWRPTTNRVGGRPANLQRPPAGPVGRPVRGAGLPPNAIGRANVHVPANLVDRPARQNVAHQNFAHGSAGALAPGSRPNPAPRQLPNRQAPHPAQHPNFQGRTGSGAFGGLNEGNRAAGFAQRGQQSRQAASFHRGGGGHFGGARGGGPRGGFHGR